MNRLLNTVAATLCAVFTLACESAETSTPEGTGSVTQTFAPLSATITDIDGAARTLRVEARQGDAGSSEYAVQLDGRDYTLLVAESAASSFYEVRSVEGESLATVETFDSGLARLQTADGRGFDAFGMDLTAFGAAIRQAVPADALTLMSDDVLSLLDESASNGATLETAHRPLMALGGAEGCVTTCGSQDGKEYCCCPTGTYCKIKVRTCDCPSTGATTAVSYFR